MKLFIASDLHGEMGPHGYDVPVGLDLDIAVFAGDIGRGPPLSTGCSVEQALRDRPVLFVAGNHEYYRTVLQDAAAEIRDRARGTKVMFLDADVVPVIDGVRFVGFTLWTDYMFRGRRLLTAAPHLQSRA